MKHITHIVLTVLLTTALMACGKSQPETTTPTPKPAAQSKPAPVEVQQSKAPETTPAATTQAAPAARNVDVCALLPIDAVQRIFEINEPVTASAEFVRQIGSNSDHLGDCGWRVGDKNIVQISLYRDDNNFAKMQKMAEMYEKMDIKPLESAEAIAGRPVVKNMQGELNWLTEDGTLIRLATLKPGSIEPLGNLDKSRALAIIVQNQISK